MNDPVLSRRSIRKYTEQSVSDELVHRLLVAATSASSANNEQPWHFVVIRERALLDAVPSFHPHSLMLRQASVAILVCGDPELQKSPAVDNWVQGCAAATENILIEAAALGLGAVWLGIHPRPERVEGMRRLLEIPERIVPFALVPVGYPAEEKPAAERYDEARVHRDRW